MRAPASRTSTERRSKLRSTAWWRGSTSTSVKSSSQGTTNLPGSVLMTISDLHRTRVRADVDETDIPMVHRSQPALVYLQADRLHPIAGKVDLVAPRERPRTTW